MDDKKIKEIIEQAHQLTETINILTQSLEEMVEEDKKESERAGNFLK